MRVLATSSEDEMVACFLQAELRSDRFGDAIRAALAGDGQPETLLSDPDTSDAAANLARRQVLATTRGYGENREFFEDFPAHVVWMRTSLTPRELARVRYMDYSYWIELSGGSRLPVDAARRIRAGDRAFAISNDEHITMAAAVARGERFPLILVGPERSRLVCLEGHLRLTAYALAGFPRPVECFVGTAESMTVWAH